MYQDDWFNRIPYFLEYNFKWWDIQGCFELCFDEHERQLSVYERSSEVEDFKKYSGAGFSLFSQSLKANISLDLVFDIKKLVDVVLTI